MFTIPPTLPAAVPYFFRSAPENAGKSNRYLIAAGGADIWIVIRVPALTDFFRDGNVEKIDIL